jgi:hypothetical protein
MCDFLFGQGLFDSCREHGQDFSATPADREVPFQPRNFVRLEWLFVVRRDQFGVGTVPGAPVIESIQGIAHPPRERFFSTAIACFVPLLWVHRHSSLT